jgi:hypothetical protein
MRVQMMLAVAMIGNNDENALPEAVGRTHPADSQSYLAVTKCRHAGISMSCVKNCPSFLCGPALLF